MLKKYMNAKKLYMNPKKPKKIEFTIHKIDKSHLTTTAKNQKNVQLKTQLCQHLLFFPIGNHYLYGHTIHLHTSR